MQQLDPPDGTEGGDRRPKLCEAFSAHRSSRSRPSKKNHKSGLLWYVTRGADTGIVTAHARTGVTRVTNKWDLGLEGWKAGAEAQCATSWSLY